MHQTIELMSMDDEIPLTICGLVDGTFGEGEGAEAVTRKLEQELIVIACDVDDLSVLSAFAEEFLDEDIVAIIPIPIAFECPTINEVADDIEMLSIVVPEEIEEDIHASVAGS